MSQKLIFPCIRGRTDRTEKNNLERGFLNKAATFLTRSELKVLYLKEKNRISVMFPIRCSMLYVPHTNPGFFKTCPVFQAEFWRWWRRLSTGCRVGGFDPWLLMPGRWSVLGQGQRPPLPPATACYSKVTLDKSLSQMNKRNVGV